jgi:hypothetical protein
MAHKHKRARIRKNVVTLLKLGVDVNQRVYASRPNLIWLTQEMPLCLVYFENEENNEEDTNPVQMNRVLKLNVEILCAGKVTEDIDDFLDDRAYEAETALFVNEGWTEDIEEIHLVNTIPYTPDTKSELFISATKLVFEIKYLTNKGEYDSYEEFLRFTSTLSIPLGEGIEVVDDVTIRES